jgi:hypothetical protein
MQQRFRPWWLAAIAIWSAVVFPARAQNTSPPGWSQFRGPNATGIAVTSKAPPTEFGPEKNLLWKTAVPPGTHRLFSGAIEFS